MVKSINSRHWLNTSARSSDDGAKVKRIGLRYLNPARRPIMDRLRAWVFKFDALRALAKNQVILIIGPAGSGKSFLASRLPIPLLEGNLLEPRDKAGNQLGACDQTLLRDLPEGPFVLEEPFYFDPATLQQCVATMRGRGFVLTIQSIEDLDAMGLSKELEDHHCAIDRPLLVVQLER